MTHQVRDAARRAHENVAAGFDVGHALAERNAAEDRLDDDVGEILAQTHELAGYLDRHLARVAEDDAGGLCVRGMGGKTNMIRVLDVLQHGNHKDARLSHAGPCLAQNIASHKRFRNTLALN